MKDYSYRKFNTGKCEYPNCIIDDERMLCVHHIDRNRDNNNIENLRTLCFNHHRIIHIEINASTKLRKPEIYETDDGMIEVIFPKHLSLEMVKNLVFLLSYRKGNKIFGNGKGGIIGFRCSKTDFNDLTQNNASKDYF